MPTSPGSSSSSLNGPRRPWPWSASSWTCRPPPRLGCHRRRQPASGATMSSIPGWGRHCARAAPLSRRALRLPNVGGVPAIIVAPILVGDEVPSYLITLDPAEESFGEDMSLLVTEHAATICGVILGRERGVAAAARRVRDDLVEGLLLGRGRDAADAARWAAHLGYDPARAHNVAAIAFHLPAPAAS